MILLNPRNFITDQVNKIDYLNSLPSKDLQVQFDDEVVVTTRRKFIYSMFFWKLHAHYPNTPLLSTHCVEHVLKGKKLSSNTHIELLSIIAKDVYHYNKLITPRSKDPVWGLIYEITNDIYNEISSLAEPNTTTIDILDFVNIATYPPILDVIQKTTPTAESISKTYGTVMDVIEKDVNLNNNALVKAVKCKMVNANQVAQCVAVRGFLTEVDGSILPVPIMSNFTRGMGSLYNLAAESRSAAKSYYFSEAPLKDAEYFARRLQLLTMTVEKIHYEDCGSTRYLTWRVNPPIIDDNGKVIYPGDLKFMLGKYYLDEETNTLKCIEKDDPSLYGKVLLIRTVLSCNHHDKHGVCHICFGALSNNVSEHANIGHVCAATMTQQTSQNVLSIKHLDVSSVSSGIVLTKALNKYFITNPAKNAYIIKKDIADKKPQLIIDRDNVQGLTDILNIYAIENINPVRISYISEVIITHENKGVVETDLLMVGQENRKAMLTIDFLKYLKEKRWTTDNKNNFIFDLSDWDFSKPVLKLPDMEYSYADHSRQIAFVIESNMEPKNQLKRNKPESPFYVLQELFNLVNTKLNVNIACLEVIIYANMIKGPNDYDLTRHVTDGVLNVSDNVIKNRSLGAAYSYENQADGIRNPRNFFKLNRPDSPFDVFIAPKEVVQHYKK